MGVIIPLIATLAIPSALFFAAINGFLGEPMRAKAEDFCLGVMGESRGSYFLKNMTPFQKTLIHEQLNPVVDVGQAGYVSGSKVGDGVGEGVGRVGQGVGNVVGGVGKGLGLGGQ